MKSRNPAPGIRLTIQDWLQALVIIAGQLQPDLALQDAFEQVVQDKLLCFTGERSQSHDPLAEVMLRQEVLEQLQLVKPSLQALFSYYVQDQEIMDNTGVPGGPSTRDMQLAKTCLPLESLYDLAYDFELVPHLLTKTDLADCFRKAKFGGHEEAAAAALSRMGEDPSRLNFQEFVDCMGRCALLAYNFRLPKEPAHLISFTQAYQTEAKKLWLEEDKRKRQEEMEFGVDEVCVWGGGAGREGARGGQGGIVHHGYIVRGGYGYMVRGGESAMRALIMMLMMMVLVLVVWCWW